MQHDPRIGRHAAQVRAMTPEAREDALVFARRAVARADACPDWLQVQNRLALLALEADHPAAALTSAVAAEDPEHVQRALDNFDHVAKVRQEHAARVLDDLDVDVVEALAYPEEAAAILEAARLCRQIIKVASESTERIKPEAFETMPEDERRRLWRGCARMAADSERPSEERRLGKALVTALSALDAPSLLNAITELESAVAGVRFARWDDK